MANKFMGKKAGGWNGKPQYARPAYLRDMVDVRSGKKTCNDGTEAERQIKSEFIAAAKKILPAGKNSRWPFLINKMLPAALNGNLKTAMANISSSCPACMTPSDKDIKDPHHLFCDRSNSQRSSRKTKQTGENMELQLRLHLEEVQQKGERYRMERSGMSSLYHRFCSCPSLHLLVTFAHL